MKENELESIKIVIKETVNGKIDRLTEKLEAHIEICETHMNDVRPVLEAYHGGKAIGGLVKWVAGVGVAWLIIQGWITGKL